MIFRAGVHSILTYGTETWAMKAENLRSSERTERVSLGIGELSTENFVQSLGVEGLASVLKRGDKMV